VLRGHERAVFLNSTDTRMRSLTELALKRDSVGAAVREASPGRTARRLSANDPSHEQLARHADDGV
jgi:hypothetical protein